VEEADKERVRVRTPIRAGLIALVAVTVLAVAPAARADCQGASVTSLSALASAVGAGQSACLANGSYAGVVDLSNPSGTPVVVSQEGDATIDGQIRINSGDIVLDGLSVANSAGSGIGGDCLRVHAIGSAAIGILDSNIGPCVRDAIRMAYNVGRHDTGVVIARNEIHGTGANACTCYMRGGLFSDNYVHDISNDALDLWGDSNVIRHNVFRNLIANPTTNHNDVLQTWQVAGDPATGDPLTNLVFSRNIIDTVSGPDSHGLMIHGGAANHDLMIRSNLFRDIGSIGMLIDGATGVSVVNNTFARAGGLDTAEWFNGATGTIDSNIFYDAASVGSQPWYQDATSSPEHAYNLAWGGALLADEPSGQNADPLFSDPDGADDNRDDDYQLSNASSPAVDHGDPAIYYRRDILGNPISGAAVDDGAFEYTGG
jgi:Right handed beta helix region